jgi:Protein of unknown function (DUF3237)
MRYSFEVRVQIADSIRIGTSESEERWFTPIVGGTVRGPDLTGTVLPYGGDWSTTRDGVTELCARYLLRAEDGATIDIENRGFWLAQQVPGPVVSPPPGEYYRTAPRFRTDAPTWRWMTSRVFVGLAADLEGDVHIRFFEVM